MTADLAALVRDNETINVGIVLYDQVEELDFVGPYEAFKAASFLAAQQLNRETPPLKVFTVAQTSDLVATSGGLRIQPDYSFADVPPIHVLVVPGGNSRPQLENAAMMSWLAQVAPQAQVRSSVCTGAFMLGKLGLLDGHTATTHWASLDRLAKQYPSVTVKHDVRWVDEGNLVTAAGVSAGIDMSLHLVERLFGRELAESTARYMEYRWNEN